MDQHTYDNWLKIKETFEASGSLDNMFYKRACEIVKTKKDPLAQFLGDKYDYNSWLEIQRWSFSKESLFAEFFS